MRSSSARSKTQGPITEAWILLADLIADAIQYARRCKACQIHVDFIHQPSELLHLTIASWPFEAWGIDVVGPISHSSTKGHRFILTITDYFSKCAEANHWLKLKLLTWLISSNTMSSIVLVSLGGSSMIMVSNS